MVGTANVDGNSPGPGAAALPNNISGAQYLPGQWMFAQLPTLNLPVPTFAYTIDVGMCFWNGATWAGFGGGTSAGPNNTPGYGANVINFGALGSTVADLTTGAVWGTTNPTSLIKVIAAAGNSQLHGIVATGAVEGNIAAVWNGSATDSVVDNNQSATCPTATDRILTSGAVQGVIPPQSHGIYRRDAALSRWTRIS